MAGRIITSETFGNGTHRFEVFETRFGDLEFFVLDAEGEAIRQSSDIVRATDGLHDVPGIGDAVARAAGAVAGWLR